MIQMGLTVVNDVERSAPYDNQQHKQILHDLKIKLFHETYAGLLMLLALFQCEFIAFMLMAFVVVPNLIPFPKLNSALLRFYRTQRN